MNAQLTDKQREFIKIATPILEELARREGQKLFYRMYPDEDTPAPPSMLDYFPSGIIHARDKYPVHMEFLEAGAEFRERCALCANRVGKALRNGTPVATPKGWKGIEELKIGEEVIAGDGSITTVTGVYPQGVKPMYRMVFDSDYTIDCCPEHLWLYQEPKARYPFNYRGKGKPKEVNKSYGKWTVEDTKTILEKYGPNPSSARMRAAMPTCEPWDLPKKKLPIEPYLFGVLLGDGMFGKMAIAISSADEEVIEAVRERLWGGMSLSRASKYDYRIVKGEGLHNPLMQTLKKMGLYYKKSHQKFIPEHYLISSIEDRLDLLRGLMDTDGSIGPTGSVEFSSTSYDLANSVRFLVTSLGGRATIEKRQTYCGEKKGRVSYRVRIRLNIQPFRLKRKADQWKPRKNRTDRILHRIEEAEPGEATCISVAHESRTFVTDHGIVTHNTFSLGGYETACHLTGEYPHWWKGKRFDRPIRAWAAGKTNETTRDIVQDTLLGKISNAGKKGFTGTGVVPGKAIGAITWKQGVSDLADTVKVRHISGGWSTLGFKSYQQGRGSFEGTAQHVIWLDEEAPEDVYGECLIRTATTNGIVMLTFTPLEGMTEIVLQFLPESMRPTTDDDGMLEV